MIQIHHCEQGSDEWMRLRAGLPTASEFSSILAKGEGKTRRAYMLRLAGEIITGEPAETFSNAHMERGKIMEDSAREHYAFLRDVEPERVGFITNDGMGCSPDSLIDDDCGLEIKTALPHIQIERLLRNDLPPEHKAQVHGSMLVADRPRWEFMSYWPKMPPLIIPLKRDDLYCATLRSEIDRFKDELGEVVEKVRRYGLAETAAA